MTDDELAGIEARVNAANESSATYHEWVGRLSRVADVARTDVPALVEEVKRLRGLVEAAHGEAFRYAWNIATGYEEIPDAGILAREWQASNARRALDADKTLQDGVA
jgi:hypothetical protein